MIPPSNLGQALEEITSLECLGTLGELREQKDGFSEGNREKWRSMWEREKYVGEGEVCGRGRSMWEREHLGLLRKGKSWMRLRLHSVSGENERY